MGLDIGGTKLVNDQGSFQIQNSSSSILTSYDNSGRLVKGTSQPMFYAYHTSAAWSAMSVSAWHQFAYSNTHINRNSSFANSVFTAPYSGIYLFSANNYIQTIVAGYYVHPVFFVNGTWASACQPYRIRGHSATASYASGCDISEVIKLTAGDIVSTRGYSGGGLANNYYPAYNFFSGWFLG